MPSIVILVMLCSLAFESALCAFETFVAGMTQTHTMCFVFDKKAVKHHTNTMSMEYSEIDDLWKLKILEFHGFDIDG